MEMAELSKGSSYVLKARGRWRGWLLLLCCLIALVGITGFPMWEGLYEEKLLNGQINALRSRGEPIFVEDFATPPCLDADNAALTLEAAALAIDQNGDRWA